MLSSKIIAALAVAGALAVAASPADARFAGGGGMRGGGGGIHMGGGGVHMGGGGGMRFGGGNFGHRRGNGGLAAGLALGAVGAGLAYGYPYYGYDDSYAYGDCSVPQRYWWHGRWYWRQAYAC